MSGAVFGAFVVGLVIGMVVMSIARDTWDEL